jgi:hypothetical protein
MTKRKPPPGAGKLSPVQIATIKAEYRSGVFTISELARRHRVDRGTIRYYRDGHGWTQDLAAEAATRALLITAEEQAQARKSEPSPPGNAEPFQAPSQAGVDLAEDDPEQRVTDSLAQLYAAVTREHSTRIARLKQLFDQHAGLIAQVIGDDDGARQSAKAKILLTPGDGLATHLRLAAGLAESIQRQERTALGLDDRKRIEHSGPGGGPIQASTLPSQLRGAPVDVLELLRDAADRLDRQRPAFGED